ncbi:carbohydrate sulfotransferase 11 isoform X2 [Cephus cinctus]|uniref:Carbohydrate sulfotransferase n=1 Tax=Cephus cinctus TaxID=211228 RepID=A0AAJ7CGV9_CEPCN|nr:carbohydrate sulfotransferase 11 isoform X2 [Cephus cinctus]
MELPSKKCSRLWRLVLIFTLLFLLAILQRPRYTGNRSQNLQQSNNFVTTTSLLNYTDMKTNRKTLSSAYSTSAEELINVRVELESRKKLLENVCANIQDDTGSIEKAISKMIINENHGISWCPIYKAASSTWMKHFVTLAGLLSGTIMDLIRENSMQMNSIVRQAYITNTNSKTILKKMNKTKKFLIVRHPFERLLSAYRDKLEYMEGREYYYERFGYHIRQSYRKDKRDDSWGKQEPTFEEFLQFVAEERQFDEHWMPYYNACRPCGINYEYILKFETLQRDQNFFIQENGLANWLSTVENVENTNPRGPTTSVIVKKYFKNIHKSVLENIYKIYEMDFKLFSYSPEKYYMISIGDIHKNESIS